MQDLQLLTDVITSHGVPSRTQPVPGAVEPRGMSCRGQNDVALLHVAVVRTTKCMDHHAGRNTSLIACDMTTAYTVFCQMRSTVAKQQLLAEFSWLSAATAATHLDTYQPLHVCPLAPAGSQPVQLFFSNPDLVWATDYPRPRFGQGAFSTMLAAVHSRLTGERRHMDMLLTVRWHVACQHVEVKQA